MSPFFKDTIAALLQCAQRHAHFEHAKVQISAFEAINDLVRSATRDTLDVVAQLIQVRVCVGGGGTRGRVDEAWLSISTVCDSGGRFRTAHDARFWTL